MCAQGRWIEDCSLLALPHITPELAHALGAVGCPCLPLLMEAVGADTLAASTSSGSSSGSGNSSRRGGLRGGNRQGPMGRGSRGGRGGGQAAGTGQAGGREMVADVLGSMLTSAQTKEVLQVGK